MGLYHKHLKGVDDLKREKLALLKEKEELASEPFFSLDGILGKDKKEPKAQEDASEDGDGSGFGIEDILNLLPVLSPALTLVGSIAGKVFSKGKGEKGGKKGQGFIPKVAKELIWGYVKWKAIELAIKGVRHMIQKKENKEGQR